MPTRQACCSKHAARASCPSRNWQPTTSRLISFEKAYDVFNMPLTKKAMKVIVDFA
jgi:hypothetical protein